MLNENRAPPRSAIETERRIERRGRATARVCQVVDELARPAAGTAHEVRARGDQTTSAEGSQDLLGQHASRLGCQGGASEKEPFDLRGAEAAAGSEPEQHSFFAGSGQSQE